MSVWSGPGRQQTVVWPLSTRRATTRGGPPLGQLRESTPGAGVWSGPSSSVIHAQPASCPRQVRARATRTTLRDSQHLEGLSHERAAHHRCSPAPGRRAGPHAMFAPALRLIRT
jgi:hypothetical protein